MIQEKTCTLCGSQPEEGMHVTGIKIIKKKETPYSLCQPCCFSQDFDPAAKAAFRNKLWAKVEQKLSGKKVK